MKSLKFPRCIKPFNIDGNYPVLLINAYGVCAYVKRKLMDGTFRSRLLASKCRVAPIKR